MPALATVILSPSLAALCAPLPAQAAMVTPLVGAVQVEQVQPPGPLINPTLAGLSWSLANAQAQQQSGQGQTDSLAEGEAQETGQNQPEEPENEIIVSGNYGPPKEDPLMRANERVFDVAEGVDQAVVGPIAYAYEEALPSPIRQGSINVLRNLREPTNFLNFLLQGKIGKAFETLGRFAINSTIGFGGLIDMAGKPGIGLPYRRNGFSDTLGFYGVGDGPFLVLPLVGSTTIRDFIGAGLDQALLPAIVGKPLNTPEYGVPAYVLTSLNFRLEFDEQLEDIRNSEDPYVELREQYLAKRHYEVELLKSGDDRAGIPGAYLEFKRSQDPVVVDPIADPAAASSQPTEESAPAPVPNNDRAALTPEQAPLAITTGGYHTQEELEIASETEAHLAAQSGKDLLRE